MKGLRAGRIAGTALIMLAAGAGSAWACDEPGGGGAQASGERGDQVAFTIPTTLRGAQYTLTIDGNEVASGQDRDEASGVSGEFTVPDLGGESGNFDVVAQVVHKADDAAWSWTAVRLDYRAKSTSEPPPPAPEPSPAPTPAPEPSAPSLASEPPSVVGPVVLGVQQLVTRKPKGGRPSRSTKARAERVAERAATTLRKAKAKKRKKAKRKKRAKAKRKRHEPAFQSGARRLQPSAGGQRAGDSFPEDEFAGLGYRVAWPFLLGAAGAGLLAILGLGGLARRRRSTRAA